MAKSGTQTSAPPNWPALSDDELLKLRICDLGLRVEGSAIEAPVRAFEAELAQRGLAFRPVVYLGDEWFSPEGEVAIAVPFYLAHPRLVALERNIMLQVEGGTPEAFRKLLRHEAGHCFDHAYGFSKRRKWRDHFGSPTEDYSPETYRPRPYSRAFVKHLENWYAQAHPDEDFAETFAVWLDPSQDWRKAYARWPVALAKLRYIDGLAQESARAKPRSQHAPALPFNAVRLKSTLERYYARRKRENADEYPDFYDADLQRIFDGARNRGAARFLKSHRKELIDSVAHWTGEHKYTAERLVRKITQRCGDLGLGVGPDETRTSFEVSAYLSALVSNYLFTGKFKRTV